MPIYSICPSCNTAYDLADSLGGKWVVCRTCNDSFLVQETLRAPSAAVPVGTAAPGVPTEPVYALAPPEGAEAVPPAARGYPQPGPEPEWERLPRRRPGRRAAPPPGLSTGAIVAIVVAPIAVLLLVGVMIWAFLARSPDSFDDDVWVDDPAPVVRPGPRPGMAPIIIPPPRFNPPANPPRFNPPPINPPRFNPPRFNPPAPPRVRFR